MLSYTCLRWQSEWLFVKASRCLARMWSSSSHTVNHRAYADGIIDHDEHVRLSRVHKRGSENTTCAPKTKVSLSAIVSSQYRLIDVNQSFSLGVHQSLSLGGSVNRMVSRVFCCRKNALLTGAMKHVRSRKRCVSKSEKMLPNTEVRRPRHVFTIQLVIEWNAVKLRGCRQRYNVHQEWYIANETKLGNNRAELSLIMGTCWNTYSIQTPFGISFK